MHRIKRLLMILPLSALIITGCDNSTTTSSSEESSTTSVTTTTSDDTSSTSSSGVTITIESVLDQLQQDFAFKGAFSFIAIDDYGELVWDETSFYIDGYIGSDRFYNIEYTTDGVETDRDEYYADEETGYVEWRYLDPTTNQTTSRILSGSSTGAPIYFASSFYNPWWYMDESMATLEDDYTVTFTISSSYGYDFFYYLTARDYRARTATVTVDPDTGIIDTVSFTSAAYVDVLNDDFVDVWYTFTYQIVDIEELDYYNVDPRESDSSTDALQNAFNSLQEGNYTADITMTTTDENENTSTVQATVYSTSDLLLLERSSAITGYVNYDSGYKTVTGTPNNNTLTYSSTTYTGSVEDYLVPFTILGNMFDYVGDNTYVYANRGTESLLYLTMPDMLYTYTRLGYTPLVNTYTWVLNDDGTIAISYDVSDTVSITVNVHHIGSTDLSGYNYQVDGSNSEPTNWALVEGAEDILALFNISTDLMPWVDEFDYNWTIYDTSNYGYAAFNSTKTFDINIVDSIDNQLRALGWNYEGVNNYSEYEYSYELNDGSGLTLHLSFALFYSGNDDDLYTVSIYPLAPDSPITEFIEENFSDYTALNYTIDTTYTRIDASTTYDEDSDTYIVNDDAITTTSSNQVLFDYEDAIWNGWLYRTSDVGIEWYRSNSDGTYTYVDRTLGSDYHVGRNYRSLYYVGYYLDRSTYTQLSFDGSVSTYSLSSNAIYFFCLATRLFESLGGYSSWDAVATYDSSEGTIDIFIQCDDGIYTVDEEKVYIYQSIEISIHDVGNTSIDVVTITE